MEIQVQLRDGCDYDGDREPTKRHFLLGQNELPDRGVLT